MKIFPSLRPVWPSVAGGRHRVAAPRSRPRAAGHGLLLLGATVIAALVATMGLGGTARAASKLQVLFSFRNLRGDAPFGGLVADGAGNLYGTTKQGGMINQGAVFELSPPAAGQRAWTETVLYSFNGRGGWVPLSGLIADGAGNLYGTTSRGGPSNIGVVFELSPPAAGQTAWTETLLRAFKGPNGGSPLSGLIADGAGNLYGTTEYGGGDNHGVVFELSPPTTGGRAWTETVLRSFSEGGYFPYGALIADAAGNLYGTTSTGGAGVAGVVFELSPPTAGGRVWTETTLYSFSGPNGENPVSGLIADGAGNLYGTTSAGGAAGDGVVFELSPPTAGKTLWTETVLHSFNGANGENPVSNLIADGAGNLYGTTEAGGKHGDGVVFELSPSTVGRKAWTETVLHAFDGTHGKGPNAGLLADGAGNLYGTTSSGGTHDRGVVFKLTP